MNTISTIIAKPEFASIEQAVLAVDGNAVYHWVKSLIFDQDGVDATCSLVPLQTWLHDENGSRIAWKLLEPAYEGSTVVPLLVCPDDKLHSCRS
jgi:hypothetical protein